MFVIALLHAGGHSFAMPTTPLSFTPTPPTLVDLEAIVRRVRDRALVWLRRRGLLDERPLEERSNEAPDPAAIDGCAAIAMYRGTLAMLPASEDEADGSSSDTGNVGAPRSAFAVERDGFNLHAGVRIEAGDDLGRERLCRYRARPPLSLERLRRLPGGRVAYRLSWPLLLHRTFDYGSSI